MSEVTYTLKEVEAAIALENTRDALDRNQPYLRHLENLQSKLNDPRSHAMREQFLAGPDGTGEVNQLKQMDAYLHKCVSRCRPAGWSIEDMKKESRN